MIIVEILLFFAIEKKKKMKKFALFDFLNILNVLICFYSL